MSRGGGSGGTPTVGRGDKKGRRQRTNRKGGKVSMRVTSALKIGKKKKKKTY